MKGGGKMKGNTLAIVALVVAVVAVIIVLISGNLTGFAITSSSEDVSNPMKTNAICNRLVLKFQNLNGTSDNDAILLIKKYASKCVKPKYCIAIGGLDLGLDTTTPSGNKFCSALGLKCSFMTYLQTSEYWNSTDGSCSGDVQSIASQSLILQCSEAIQQSFHSCKTMVGGPAGWMAATEPFYGDINEYRGSTNVFCCNY